MFKALAEYKSLWVALLIVIGLWIWVGGFHKESAKQGLFIKSPAPLDTGEAYNAPSIYRYKEDPKGTLFQNGFHNGQMLLRGLYSVITGEGSSGVVEGNAGIRFSYDRTIGGNLAESEFLTIQLAPNAKTAVELTGWRLKSLSTGQEATIGKAVYFPFSNQVNVEQNLKLEPGERALIITGRSPLGYSFRLNQCIGYFEQFQSFTPSLPRECPAPDEEGLPKAPNQLNDRCLDYLSSYPRCRIPTGGFPDNLSPECKIFLTDKMNYTYCVDHHKNEPGFFKHEWRIYLGRSQTLWKSRRENIELIDPEGVVRDSIVY